MSGCTSRLDDDDLLLVLAILMLTLVGLALKDALELLALKDAVDVDSGLIDNVKLLRSTVLTLKADLLNLVLRDV